MVNTESATCIVTSWSRLGEHAIVRAYRTTDSSYGSLFGGIPCKFGANLKHSRMQLMGGYGYKYMNSCSVFELAVCLLDDKNKGSSSLPPCPDARKVVNAIVPTSHRVNTRPMKCEPHAQ